MNRTLAYFLTPQGRRRLKWEFLGRIHPLVTFDYDGGLKLSSPRRNKSARKAFIQGYDNPALLRWLEGVLKPGMTVLDVGANVGLYTLFMARRVGPEGRVVAIEADPDTAVILERNVRASGFSNVTIANVAVGSELGNLRFQRSAKNRGESHISSAGEAGSVEVPVKTLDSLCAELSLGPIGYVKMDVEGYEVAALQGFHSRLASDRAMVVQTELMPRHLARYGKTPEDLRAALEPLGYVGHDLIEGELSAYDFSKRSGDVIWTRA
ncbi:MAG: FkbM family methyltransferase [Armatimonadetes bacterium]|nr:FkbM family methyltransferase [Armatimonadota bacterium]